MGVHTVITVVSITPKRADSKVPDLRVVMTPNATQVDVLGIRPLAPSYEHKVHGVPGHAAVMRENSKTSGYKDGAEADGDLFAPFVIESFGGLGEKALDLLLCSLYYGWPRLPILSIFPVLLKFSYSLKIIKKKGFGFSL